MARAYECDGCGMMIKQRSKVIGTWRGASGKIFHFYINFSLKEAPKDYRGKHTPDLCSACMRLALSEVRIIPDTADAEEVTRS